MICLAEDKAGGVLVRVHVQPRASKNRIAGLHGDALKVCVTAPPVEGEANRAITAFLAALFGIPKSAIELKTGDTSRAKLFRLTGISLAAAEAVLRGHL